MNLLHSEYLSKALNFFCVNPLPGHDQEIALDFIGEEFAKRNGSTFIVNSHIIQIARFYADLHPTEVNKKLALESIELINQAGLSDDE